MVATLLRRNGQRLFLGLLVLLLIAMVLAVGTGALDIPARQVLRALGSRLGLTDTGGLGAREISTVWDLRLPRVLLGALVGAALAMAGASLQGLFGNPLADPGIVGVSQGAALGAVAAIVGGAGVLGEWTVPLAAFLGAAGATALAWMLAARGPGADTATLLLVGIALGAGCSAAIGFFTYVASENDLPALVFWQMGSLAAADWADLAAALPVFVLGAIALQSLATPLDMLALGERQARHLGLDVARTRLKLVAFSALLVGAAVAFAGSVGFVGLVVPHVVRMLAGPGHRWLLPTSAVLGALLVVVADTAARTLDPPSEIPLGLFSAALGAPFFLWLVLRQRRGGGA